MIATIYGCVSTNDENIQTPKVYGCYSVQEQLIRQSEEIRKNDAIHETLRFIAKYAERLEGELGRYQVLCGESTDEMRHEVLAIHLWANDKDHKLVESVLQGKAKSSMNVI